MLSRSIAMGGRKPGRLLQVPFIALQMRNLRIERIARLGVRHNDIRLQPVRHVELPACGKHAPLIS
jgi:hypothetical protein